MTSTQLKIHSISKFTRSQNSVNHDTHRKVYQTEEATKIITSSEKNLESQPDVNELHIFQTSVICPAVINLNCSRTSHIINQSTAES